MEKAIATQFVKVLAQNCNRVIHLNATEYFVNFIYEL